MNKIDFFSTYIDAEAKARVSEVLDSTLISEGKVTLEFEKALEEKLGIRNIVTVNSGTTALHLALVLAGVGPDDEVILPAQTFIATGLVALMQGAKPVFADILYESGNIDPADIKRKISPKTKAIIVVHWAGAPCDMKKIMEIAHENKLIVIEDAAHALGAEYENQKIGNIAHYTCFSFQAIKHLTTGDGGAISCLDKEKYEEAKRRRWFGMDRANSQINFLGERECNITELGFKYHLNNYSSALGLANLTNFDKRLARRRFLANKYEDFIKGFDGLRVVKPSGYEFKTAAWIFPTHVERREDFIRYMRSCNIPVSVVHQGIDQFAVFKNHRTSLPTQRAFDDSQIHLPLHDHLNDEQQEYIISTMRRGW